MPAVPEHGHEPVMMEEVLGHLRPGPGEVFMDCTAGRGGHAVRIAERLSPGGKLIALDVDPENLKFARRRMEQAGGAVRGVEIRTFHANFAEAGDVLAALGIEKVDGLLADFGVSTNQLLEGKHGMSFAADQPLDMRLDPRIKARASDLLASWDEKRIAAALREYAQERFARKIARKIVQTRHTEPILTTGQLARLVRSVVPASSGQIDPATRTFQAIRMAVNSEIESLEGLLAGLPEMIKAGGRAAFISFHSGEDRLVKRAVKAWEHDGLCEVATPKPVEPTSQEQQRNSRSRSAKLRAVVWKS